jgi:hypothetical protein
MPPSGGGNKLGVSLGESPLQPLDFPKSPSYPTPGHGRLWQIDHTLETHMSTHTFHRFQTPTVWV